MELILLLCHCTWLGLEQSSYFKGTEGVGIEMDLKAM